MSAPSGWYEMTGQGELDWGEWVTVTTFGLFTVIDPLAKANFVPGNHPQQVVKAGGVGLGNYGDADPFGNTDICEISLWRWLAWEYETVRENAGLPLGFAAHAWRLRPGVTAYLKLNI